MSSSVRGRYLHSVDVQWGIRAIIAVLSFRVFRNFEDVFYGAVLVKLTLNTECNGKVLL